MSNRKNEYQQDFLLSILMIFLSSSQVRIPDFQSGDTGSNPVPNTILLFFFHLIFF